MEQYQDLSILIIDDEERVLKVVSAFFKKLGLLVMTAKNGTNGLKIFKEKNPDIVISDLKMPEIDGFQVIEKIKRESKYTPIVIISGEGDTQDAIKAMQMGAWDYLLKPVYDIGVLEHTINKVLERRNLLLENKHYQENLEKIVKERTAKLHHALEGTLQVIIALVELRDPYTAGHQKNVAQLAKAIAREMSLDNETITCIYRSAAIHDLGKIALPAEILTKPTGLTENEYMLIKDHPEYGYNLLKPIDFPWPIDEIVYQHHESIDGSGYPKGLKNNEILLEAKIISVADVIDAVASHRPYRASLGFEYAVDLVTKYNGIHFDRDVVKACLSLHKKNKIYEILHKENIDLAKKH